MTSPTTNPRPHPRAAGPWAVCVLALSAMAPAACTSVPDLTVEDNRLCPPGTDPNLCVVGSEPEYLCPTDPSVCEEAERARKKR